MVSPDAFLRHEGCAQAPLLAGGPVIQVRLHVEPLDRADLSRSDKITILRGQLTIIRTRAEQGIPVSVESITRAERLAWSLESEELAA